MKKYYFRQFTINRGNQVIWFGENETIVGLAATDFVVPNDIAELLIRSDGELNPPNKSVKVFVTSDDSFNIDVLTEERIDFLGYVTKENFITHSTSPVVIGNDIRLTPPNIETIKEVFKVFIITTE